MSKKLLRIASYAILFLIVFASATTVFAQDDEPTDDEVNKIAKQLYCPVCESTPLDVCPTEACRQWRDTIRQLLSEGKSEDEIKKYFETNYGARALDEPPNRLITYGVPVAAFLAGAFMLYRGFRMWLKPVEADSSASQKEEAEVVPQDDYIRRMEEELKKRK
jgi:cytochrome c-type biogenesis protein CcmH